MRADRVKITCYVTPETDEKIKSVMKKTGLTKSKVSQLSIVSGVDVIALSFDADWRAYFDAKIRLDNESK